MLHNAVSEAITKKAQMENADINRIRSHIEQYQSNQDMGDIHQKQERLKAIQERIDQLTNMDSEAAQNGDFDAQFESLYTEKYGKETVWFGKSYRLYRGNDDHYGRTEKPSGGIQRPCSTSAYRMY